jgi:predicted N-formylglutamate amidohydrolase
MMPQAASLRSLITCEHASALVPEGIELGLSDAILATHVSTDRGAREIALELAERLAAPVHLGAHSRLVVDLNRREDNPDVIVSATYGLVVPGNVGLSLDEREDRIARFHRPYREAARADALRLADAGGCLHLSIHSFDPSLDPAARAFDAGVLFDPSRSPENTIAARLCDALAACGLSVRLNEPYLGTPEGLTSWLRGQIPEERYVGIEIEACQGWMDRPGALSRFAEQLARSVRAAV